MVFSFKAHLILILPSKGRFSCIVEAIFSRSAKVIMHAVSVTTICSINTSLLRERGCALDSTRNSCSCVRHTLIALTSRSTLLANLGAPFAVSIRVTSKDETEAAAPSSPTIEAATLIGSMVD